MLLLMLDLVDDSCTQGPGLRERQHSNQPSPEQPRRAQHPPRLLLYACIVSCLPCYIPCFMPFSASPKLSFSGREAGGRMFFTKSNPTS